MGVPLYIKGVIMEQVIELGSFWLIKDSGCIAIVRSMVGESNGGLTVVYTVTDNSGASSYRMSCEYELFINIAEKLITKSDLKDELNNEYVKGKTDGYNEGYQHGFTLAKEKITELDKEELESEYQRGLKEGKYLERLDSLNSRQHHYHLGYDDALTRMASEEAENNLELKKQGYEEGYDGGFEDGFNTAIREMSNNQLLGETTEYEFGTEDCCEHHNPNKETQEAMQVLDKDTNEFEGIWVAKDGSGKLKVINVNGGSCDVELVEHVSNSFLCIGDTATISVDYLKEHWTKERAECNYITTEDDQLEKELELVEKYPHYYKDIHHLNIIDIYRFFDLFEVTDPCIQHSMKKLAVGGKRGAKDYEKDIKEAMDTLKRWEYMQEENKRGLND